MTVAPASVFLKLRGRFLGLSQDNAYSGATRTRFRAEGEHHSGMIPNTIPAAKPNTNSGLKPNTFWPTPERCSAWPRNVFHR